LRGLHHDSVEVQPLLSPLSICRTMQERAPTFGGKILTVKQRSAPTDCLSANLSTSTNPTLTALSSNTGLRLELPASNHQTLTRPLQSKSKRRFGNFQKFSMDIMYLHLIDDKIITANIHEFASSNHNSLRSAIVLSVLTIT